MQKFGYKFSFGPWNIHEGADPFGPTVRPRRAFADKLKEYKKLGFDAVQFHDDDAVPDLDRRTPSQMRSAARAMRKTIDNHGLVQFVACILDGRDADRSAKLTRRDDDLRGT